MTVINGRASGEQREKTLLVKQTNLCTVSFGYVSDNICLSFWFTNDAKQSYLCHADIKFVLH